MNGGDDDAAFQALERAREMAKQPGFRRRRRRQRAEGGLEAGPGLGNAGSGAHPSSRDPARIGDVAESLLELRGWSETVEEASVVGRWREIVGDAVADHTEVERFEDGRLVIRASSTPWATQVRLLLGELRRRIAAEVGPDRVTEIVVLGPAGPTWKHGLRSVKGRGPRDTYG